MNHNRDDAWLEVKLSSDYEVQQLESVASGKSPREPPRAMETLGRSHTSIGPWNARGIIVAVACALAWFTCGRWGDSHIACGREIYWPAAMSQGTLLSR